MIRWPEGRPVTGRSACDACGKALSAPELIPVLSFLALRGRCAGCGAALDRRHLAVEIAAGLVGAAALAAWPGLPGLITALFGWWLLLIAALDAEHQWLPDRLTLPLAAVGLAVGWAGIGPPLTERLIGAAAGFIVLAGIALLYRGLRGREGLGGGDPKLFGALGAWLGWQALPLVLLGAGLIGFAALLLKHLRGERIAAADRLPLGTFLALAAWPLWLFGAGLGSFSMGIGGL